MLVLLVYRVFSEDEPISGRTVALALLLSAIAANMRFQLHLLVALATVAAPTYFPIHLSPEGLPYIDGSLWARNPLALALIEAIGVLDWPRHEIEVLSLGCTSEHLNVSWQKRISLGASYWGARIADVFMKAQSSSAIAAAHSLVGSKNVVRIRISNPEKRGALDHEILDTLRDAVSSADARCLLITGDGPVFSAGYDIGNFSDENTFADAAEKLVAHPFTEAMDASDARYKFAAFALSQ